MKLIPIASSMSDVILLSDTRVISSKGITSTQQIQKSLRDCKICSYSAFFHSNSNSRGVAILIRNDLCYNVLAEYKDGNEKFYMMDIEINKKRYGIGAVYGPNNTSRDFYRYLRNSLAAAGSNGCNQIILGGDWNTTVDRRPVTDNIDTFYMSGLPNPKNSELLEQLCRDFFFLYMFFVIFSPLLPITEVSPQASAIPGGNPPGDRQSPVGWGDAGFETGTDRQSPVGWGDAGFEPGTMDSNPGPGFEPGTGIRTRDNGFEPGTWIRTRDLDSNPGQGLCRDFALVDPYRVLYPNKRDYTYSPFGNVRLNRSRLDFFVISSCLVGNISECCIADSVSCKLFDHKPVCLKLNKPVAKTSSSCRLNNLFLDNELLSLSVEIAVRRVHLYSLRCYNANRNNTMLRERELAMIRDALTAYKNMTVTLCSIASRGGGISRLTLI
jgi:exonuclease III